MGKLLVFEIHSVVQFSMYSLELRGTLIGFQYTGYIIRGEITSSILTYKVRSVKNEIN